MPILVVCLLFATSQALWITDCPCNLLCQDKNSCDPKDAPQDDCCSRHGDQEKKDAPCFHLEPQSELDGEPPTLDLDFPMLTLFPRVDPEPRAGRPETAARGPTRDRPRHLQHSPLLI